MSNVLEYLVVMEFILRRA